MKGRLRGFVLWFNPRIVFNIRISWFYMKTYVLRKKRPQKINTWYLLLIVLSYMIILVGCCYHHQNIPEEQDWRQGTSRGRPWEPCRTWWRWQGVRGCCPSCASVAAWRWRRWWCRRWRWWWQWPGNPEVLLKRSCQWRKDGLGGLVAVKGRGGSCGEDHLDNQVFMLYCGGDGALKLNE